MPVKHIASPARQPDSRGLAAVRVEQRNKDCLGTARRDGEVHPGPVRGGTKRLGFACGDPRIARDAGRRRPSGAQVITVGAWRPV